MSFEITWVGFDKSKKSQLDEIISLFNEQGVRDELGFGSIRDIIANHLFPGTTTVQTRARYFLLVPYIYLQLEHEVSHSKRLRDSLDKRKQRLVELEQSLRDELKNNGKDGVIGIRSKDLDRYPSDIYWNGLKKFGLFLGKIDRDQYLETMPEIILRAREYKKAAKRDEADFIDPPQSMWSQSLRDDLFKSDFSSNASLNQMPDEERHFLKEKIIENQPQSLFAFLLDKNIQTEDIDWPWFLSETGKLPEAHVNSLANSEIFSEYTHMAVVVYYFLCALRTENNDLIAAHEQHLKEAFAEFKDLEFPKDTLGRFFKFFRDIQPLKNIESEKRFLLQWGEILENAKSEKRLWEKDVKILISDREKRKKTEKRSRLTGEIEVLKRWENSRGVENRAGAFSYRWGTVKKMISDIRGLS